MTIPARRLLARAARLLRGGLNLLVYPLASLVPRDSKAWAFGHQDDRFAGNAKYLFLWTSLHRPDLRVSWITGDKALRRRLREAGYRADLRWSAAGMRHALRAGAHFFDHSVSDVNLLLSKGARLINLWHGVGLKPVQFNDPGCVVSTHAKYRSHFLTRALFLDYLTDPDIVVATSPFMREHFAKQFRLPELSCPELGYPRLDPAADAALRRAALDLDQGAAAGAAWGSYAEHYIYLPTFRDTERPFLDEALPDLARLSAVLEARDAVLYVNLHPKTREALRSPYANVRPWPAGVDYYPYLDRFDGLISDYSSVFYDFIAVRGTGAIAYTFDHERYTASDRNLLYDYAEHNPGVRASTFGELCDLLRDGRALSAPGPRHMAVRDLFWGGASFPASPAVVRYVEAMLAHG